MYYSLDITECKINTNAWNNKFGGLITTFKTVSVLWGKFTWTTVFNFFIFILVTKCKHSSYSNNILF